MQKNRKKLSEFSAGNKFLLMNLIGLLFLVLMLLTAHNHIITSIQVTIGRKIGRKIGKKIVRKLAI
jgi:hypothetical protein